MEEAEMKTAWLPSILLADDYPLQFACVWTPQSSINQVFTHRVEAILQNQTIDAIAFRMKNFDWKVLKKSGCFQSIGMEVLQNQLKLQDSDLIFVAIKDPCNIRLLILCSNGLEKICS
ncbi:hypothetical protein RHSIM_Rhsim10G0197800 [Rhododendron simsii]|uniref:Uncharacterized protein n=1 Tax=Rhododendron simsii TaxID=118357 RepID=A0A834GD87_RHOSS|nr:hypothetical protein RHSIM_Rhsim10G0197800 [Rhododendron simsii]